METILDVTQGASVVLLAFVMLLVSKICLDFLTPFKLDDQMTAKDNPAFGVSLVGYYIGILIIIAGATQGEGLEDIPFWRQLLIDAGWAAGGIALLNVSRLLLDKVALPKFSVRKELIEDRNVGMGAVEFGVYIGSSLVIAGAINGEGGDVLTALTFWALGQVSLIALVLVYEKVTPYSFHEQLEKDNLAAGLAFAGNAIAMGVVLLKGSTVPFVSYQDNLLEFAYYFTAALVLVVIGRWAIDLVLLPGRTLTQEIVEDQNVNAGFLEGGLLIGFAGVMSLVV
ncbi:MAG: DUF350 domain-containing protein [Planctomycetota bacterium]